MATLLPRDADNTPIPTLGLKPGGAHTIAVTATSARNATAFAAETRVIGVYATGPVFIRTGDNTVTATATDHYLPPDTYCDIAIGGSKRSQCSHLAAIRASYDCVVYVSEKE